MRSLSHAVLVGRATGMAWERGLFVHACLDGQRCEGPGLPDLIIAGPGGILWREVKSRAAPQLRLQQRGWIQMLRASGQDAGVWGPGDYEDGTVERELDALTVRRPGLGHDRAGRLGYQLRGVRRAHVLARGPQASGVPVVLPASRGRAMDDAGGGNPEA